MAQHGSEVLVRISGRIFSRAVAGQSEGRQRVQQRGLIGDGRPHAGDRSELRRRGAGQHGHVLPGPGGDCLERTDRQQVAAWPRPEWEHAANRATMATGSAVGAAGEDRPAE